MGLAALDAVMRRARAAPLLLSLPLADSEGTRVGREETCTRACMSAARQWATHVPLHRGPAMGWFAMGRETERAAAGPGHIRVYVKSLSLTVCPCGAVAPEGV
jgi:hypothetical protein